MSPAPSSSSLIGLGHASRQKIGERSGEGGASDHQIAGSPQRAPDRAVGLGDRLLDEGRPVRADDLRRSRQYRAMRRVLPARDTVAVDRCLKRAQRGESGIVFAAEDQTNVGMCDEPAGSIQNEGVAGFADMDR